MKKRIGMLLMLSVVLTGCGVSQAEFEELAKRVEVLESQKETESENESMVSKEEFQQLLERVEEWEEQEENQKIETQKEEVLTSIACNTFQMRFFDMTLFDKMEEATENPAEVETNLFSGMGNILYDVCVPVDFYIPTEMENVAVKRYSNSSSDNVNLKKHEGSNIVYGFCDEWSTADVPGSILYEVAYNGKTAYFAVKLK